MTERLTVDRSELADTAQPDRLAELLVDQLSRQTAALLPISIENVAKACGIIEIQRLDTDAFEGGLIQDAHKTKGYILIREGSSIYRQRFTIGHELGHFLNLRHVAPRGNDRILCTQDDLQVSGKNLSHRLSMEAQANEFSACLLMPRAHIPRRILTGSPEIARILELHKLCNVSKEAAARRYADLHGDALAIIISQNGTLIRSPIRGGDFPWIDLKPGQGLYRDCLTRRFHGSPGEISEQEDSDPGWWLDAKDSRKWEIWEEVIAQREGFCLTLLVGERV